MGEDMVAALINFCIFKGDFRGTDQICILDYAESE